jgi:hypothetical protein
MDCIAGRKTVGEITGDILVNGHVKEQATWSRVVGYCEQMVRGHCQAAACRELAACLLQPTAALSLLGQVLALRRLQDIHTPAQTVVEALWFSARLRLPRETTDEEVRGCKGTMPHAHRRARAAAAMRTCRPRPMWMR